VPVPLTFVARSLPDRSAGPEQGDERLDIGAALAALAREYPRAAEVSRLRYLESCDVGLISEIVGVSLSTVEKDLAFARAWLRRWIERGG
jgi:DNA-directed RNA polymerase specialized sigma24 family protein